MVAELELVPLESSSPPSERDNGDVERYTQRTQTISKVWIVAGTSLIAVAALYLGMIKWDIEQTVALQNPNPVSSSAGEDTRRRHDQALQGISRMRDYDETRYDELEAEEKETAHIWNIYETINIKRRGEIRRLEAERFNPDPRDLNFNDMKRSLLLGVVGILAVWRGKSLKSYG